MANLRLAALDADDLAIVSAHLQDAVLNTTDLIYQPRQRVVALAMNRFDWAGSSTGRRSRQAGQMRRRAMLRIERVLGARRKGISSGTSAVLSLLAITFEPAQEPPAGTIVLIFSGAAEIRLDVECIEVALEDLGPAWSTPNRPSHAESEEP